MWTTSFRWIATAIVPRQPPMPPDGLRRIGLRITARNAVKAGLARCSADTALRDIPEVLERGILLKNPGRGRSTSDRLSEPEHVGG